MKLRVELLTKPGCHLCEDARAVIERVTRELGVEFIERDISGSPADLAEYGDFVPVTLVDGRVVDHWRVREDRLRAALS